MNNQEIFNKVLSVVCNFYRISYKLVLSKSRKHKFVLCRQVIMKLIYDNTEMTYNEIGLFLKKDHCTVMHGCKTIQDFIDTDMKFAWDYVYISKRLGYFFKIVNEGKIFTIEQVKNAKKSMRRKDINKKIALNEFIVKTYNIAS